MKRVPFSFDKCKCIIAADNARNARRLPTLHYRNDLNAARNSFEKISGCSHAAKCPPLSSCALPTLINAGEGYSAFAGIFAPARSFQKP